MSIVISSVGTKGGTGKTSLVKHFGIAKCEEGKRVLIIDLCQNSDIATRLGYDRTELQYDTYDWVSGVASFEQVCIQDKDTGLHFIPSSELVEKIMEYAAKKSALNQEWILKQKIDEIRDQYDYILLDNHPTETNRMMIMSLVASDIAMIPTLMDISSVLATVRTAEFIQTLQAEKVALDYYVVPMAIDFSKGFKIELKELLEKFTDMGMLNFTSPIRYSAAVLRAGLNNEILNLDNKYVRQVMEDYREMATSF